MQNAVDAIYKTIGVVKALSKVYETPALGFQGDTFYNACLVVDTVLKPNKILQELLHIEIQQGRVRTLKEGYESRVIDLDILFIEEEVIDTKSLLIPHPELHNRRFVLEPLAAIASNIMHPTLHKSVSVLLEECPDNSILEPLNIWLKTQVKGISFQNIIISR